MQQVMKQISTEAIVTDFNLTPVKRIQNLTLATDRASVLGHGLSYPVMNQGFFL